jgi:hypothetical protein
VPSEFETQLAEGLAEMILSPLGREVVYTRDGAGSPIVPSPRIVVTFPSREEMANPGRYARVLVASAGIGADPAPGDTFVSELRTYTLMAPLQEIAPGYFRGLANG